MSQPLIYVDRSRIIEGKLDDLREAMDDLVEFVNANEPDLLAYNVYFDEARTRMTVVHVHADSDSLAFHMKVAGPRFPPFAEFIRMESIDIYGEPRDGLVERLNEKAETLGTGVVRVHDHHAGVDRLAAV